MSDIPENALALIAEVSMVMGYCGFHRIEVVILGG